MPCHDILNTVPDGRGALFDTSPPEAPIKESLARRCKQRLVGGLSKTILPVVKMAARPYMGGDTPDDALCVANRLAGEGFATTLGHWDTGRESARQIVGVNTDAVQRLAGYDSYVSLKPPALRYAPEAAIALAEAAAAHGVRLHCDSHGPDVADLSNAFADMMLLKLGKGRLGTTLPGRWSRSLRDADWAIERGLNVRVVKGQWPDPADPRRDVCAGFLEVIGRLAGRARHVAVATHDFVLGREAVQRLRAAGTPCELELLLGMPAKPLIRWARENDVKVRIYVPYGEGFVPNAVGVLRRNPRLLLAVAKERMSTLAGLAPVH